MSVKNRYLAVWGCGNDGRLGLGMANPNPLLLATASSRGNSNNNNNSLHQSSPVISPFFYDWITQQQQQQQTSSSSSRTILSIHVGGYHTIVRTTDGVFGFGLNEQGQLGTGAKHTPHYTLPTRIAFFDSFASEGSEGDNLIDIACGAYHTVAWLKQGIFVCGSNEHGQLGLSPASTDGVFSFVKVESLGHRSPTSSASGKSDSSGDSEDDTRRFVTHIGAGTSHTLIALQNVFLPTRISREQKQHNASWDGQEQIAFYPAAVVAAGKGDFGELGYDPDAWDCLTSQEKRIQRQVQSQAQYVQRGGNAADVPTNSDSNLSSPGSAPGAKKKPSWVAPVRRPEFSSATFRVVEFAELDDVADRLLQDELDSAAEAPSQKQIPTKWSVVGLKAMHLRSAVQLTPHYAVGSSVVADKTTQSGEPIWFTFGCSYCDGVETLPNSIPRPFVRSGLEELVGRGNHAAMKAQSVKRAQELHCAGLQWENPQDVLDLHAAEELLFLQLARNSSTPSEKDDETNGQIKRSTSVEIAVLGKGHLGLIDDEEGSYEPLPRVLCISASGKNPQSKSEAEQTNSSTATETLRSVTGRAHYLFWTTAQQQTPAAALETPAAGDTNPEAATTLPPPSAVTVDEQQQQQQQPSPQHQQQRDVVCGFGDNLFGQVGEAVVGMTAATSTKPAAVVVDESERVTRPRVVLRSAWRSATSGAVDTDGASLLRVGTRREDTTVRVGRILAVGCGARHSVALVEEA